MMFKEPSTPLPLINFLRQYSSVSRRAILQKIASGLVRVNGTVIWDAQHALTGTDAVYMDQVLIQPQPVQYYRFHKPVGVVSTMDDPKNRSCLAHYIAKNRLPRTLRPIGRLDRDSSGLLLFSNDGMFIHRVLHPSHAIAKMYRITVDAPLRERSKRQFREGFFLEDGPVQGTIERVFSPRDVLVSITMGRNRILRRAFAHMGYTIQTLHRTGIGGISLGSLAPGAFAAMDADCIKTLVSQSIT